MTKDISAERKSMFNSFEDYSVSPWVAVPGPRDWSLGINRNVSPPQPRPLQNPENIGISLLCPTRARPMQMARFWESALATADNPQCLEIVYYIDSDDHDSLKQASTMQDPRVKTVVGPRFIQLVGVMWNRAYRISGGDIVCQGCDDFEFRTEGWDTIIKENMYRVDDNLLLVYPDDGNPKNRGFMATIFFLHRNWVEAAGYFAPPYFISYYIDRWVLQVASDINRVIYNPGVLITHNFLEAAVKDDTRDLRAHLVSNANNEGFYRAQEMKRLYYQDRLINAMEGNVQQTKDIKLLCKVDSKGHSVAEFWRQCIINAYNPERIYITFATADPKSITDVKALMRPKLYTGVTENIKLVKPDVDEGQYNYICDNITLITKQCWDEEVL